MSKKRIIILLVLWGIFAATIYVVRSGKDSGEDEKEKTAKKDYVIKLSEDDINGTHIKLYLNKNVTVDADITPISEYRDGVNSYFTKYNREQNKITYKKYKKTPTFLDCEVKELIKMVEKNTKGKFLSGKIATDKGNDNDYYCDVDFVNKDNKNGYLTCIATGDDNKKIFEEHVNFAYVSDEPESLSKIFIATTLVTNHSGFDEAELSFGTKSDIGEKLSGLVKDITKSDNYNEYKCVVLNEKTFATVADDKNLLGDMGNKKLDKECYVYFFPFKIDGFEWKSSEGLNIFEDLQEVQEFDVAEDVAYTMSVNPGLHPLNANEQAFVYSEDGIEEMDLYGGVKVEGIYKEKQEVLPINNIVDILQAYYESKAPLETKIFSIKLCYTGMYTDAQDGKLRNIAKPCWCVEYKQNRNKFEARGCLFIDVSTGDVYE